MIKESSIDMANSYMDALRNAVIKVINIPDSIYYGREGHLRLAREIGQVLGAFDIKAREEILHGSYSRVYVRVCDLKPILDAKEWVKAMKQGAAEHIRK